MNLHQSDTKQLRDLSQALAGFKPITCAIPVQSSIMSSCLLLQFKYMIFFIHLFTRTIQMSILSKMNDRLLKEDWTVVALMVFLFKMFLYDFASKDKATQVDLAFK